MPDSASAKETALELLRRLDDDVTYEDIIHEIHVPQKIERGLEDVEQGRMTPHEDAKDRLSEWLE